MDFNDNFPVEETQSNSVPDDAAQGGTTTSDALSEFIAQAETDKRSADADTEETSANDDTAQQQGDDDSEPVHKGLKARIQAAQKKADLSGYERGKAEAAAEWERERADYMSKLERYAEMELEADAKELSEKEHCSVEFAKRLLRLERGVNPKATTETQAAKGTSERDSQGRFTAKANDSSVNERAQALYEQAQRVTQKSGVDVLKLFSENADIRRRVGTGEIDFNDLALETLSASAQRNAPTPIRTGGARTDAASLNFDTMTSEEFARFNRRLDEGAVFRTG